MRITIGYLLSSSYNLMVVEIDNREEKCTQIILFGVNKCQKKNLAG